MPKIRDAKTTRTPERSEPPAAPVRQGHDGGVHELTTVGGTTYCNCFCRDCHDAKKQRCVCARCGCEEHYE